MIRFSSARIFLILLLVLSATSPTASLYAQSLEPSAPSKEYVRAGGRMVAAELRASTPSGPVSIVVFPSTASLGPSQSQQFSATVTGSGNTSVTWSVSPSVGSINSNGLYMAPAVIGTAQSVTVRATSQADPSKSATATVTFYSPSTSGYFPVFGSFLNFYRNMPQELWAKEFDLMREVDMDTIVVVSVGRLRSSASDPLGYSLSPEGLLYPSAWVPPAERPTTDRLEMILSLADQRGMKVYLGSLQTEADWSTGLEFTALREYNKRVATEILQLYGNHPSLRGWYFTQEIWMNWVKYYGSTYYGTALMRDFVADMKVIDPTKRCTAAVVFKKTGYGAMPGLTPAELQSVTTGFLQTTGLDILMPQDGAGAEEGAAPLSELASYFAAMAAARDAAATGTVLWSTTETFTANPYLSNDRYPPADVFRIDQQVNAIRPYVTGYVSWIFGNDMSPQATYYPVEASALNREYRSRFKPQYFPRYEVFPLQSYQASPAPSPYYPDSPYTPKLSDRTGGGYNGYSLAHWVGFRIEETGGVVRISADLGSSRDIRMVRALSQSWVASGIYRPRMMTVEVSSDGVNWTLFGSTNSFPNDTLDFAVMWGEVGGFATARYVRCTFSHIAWLFLSELEVLGVPSAPPPPTVSVSVTPSSVALSENQSQQFTAAVTGTTNTAVTWSMSPIVGSLINGLYTAPSYIPAPQIVTVRATSQADPTKSGAGTVNLVQTTAPPPRVGPMNPDQGTGLSHLFSFDTEAGSGSIQWIQVLFSASGVTQTNGCLVYYRTSDDIAAVSADAATPENYQWAGWAVIGTQGVTVSNSQCTLDYQNSWVVKNGSRVTLNLSLSFAPSWSGTKDVFMAAADSAQTVAWPYVGYWTIP
jgi:hypothetical protein